MKKIIYVLSTVSLLFLFSVISLAVSNEYIFSDIWNKTAYLNSYTIANNTNYSSDVIVAPTLILNNGTDSVTFGFSGDGVTFSGIDFNSARASSFDVSIPFGYYLNSYETLNYQMYLLLPSNNNVTVTATAVLTNSNTVSINCNSIHYDTGSLQSYTLNSSGGIASVDTVFSANDVYQLDLSLPSASGNYDIDYIIISFTLDNSVNRFILGSIGSNNIVALPDSITYLLGSISKKINLTNDRILQLINELKLTNGKIDDILSALASSAAGTTVLTQFLQTPSAEQQEVTEQLEELLEEAQEELAAVKDVLESVQTPTFESLVTENIDGHIEAAEIYNTTEFSEVTSSILNIPGLTTMLIMVFSLATFSFILFGKKG